MPVKGRVKVKIRNRVADLNTTPQHLPHRCVLLFIKAPEIGKVKTRLVGRLDAAVAANLYKCFTADILETLESHGYPVTVCYHPPAAEKHVVQWLGNDYVYQPQQGKDLGERMAGAFSQAFADGRREAVLIGSDFPDLPGIVIDEAFSGLTHSEAVIGPATDGGYYLIGFRSDGYFPELFRAMPWGTPTVLRKTMDLFAAHECGVHVLPEWRDIDEYADLEYFIKNRIKGASAAPNTVNYLRSIGLV